MLGADDFEFEKCGDVIVAPKHNIFALTCSLCHDVFMGFDEFRTHIIKEHDVYLGISNAESVSTDEEETDRIDQNDTIEDVEQSGLITKDEEQMVTGLEETSTLNEEQAVFSEASATLSEKIDEETEKGPSVAEEDTKFVESNEEKSVERIYESKLPESSNEVESSNEIESMEAMDVDESSESVNNITEQKSDSEPTEEYYSNSTEHKSIEVEKSSIDESDLCQEANNVDQTSDTSEAEKECKELNEGANSNKQDGSNQNIQEDNIAAVSSCQESNNVVQTTDISEAEKDCMKLCETVNGHEHDAENETDIDCATVEQITNKEIEEDIVESSVPITAEAEEKEKTDLEKESDELENNIINNELPTACTSDEGQKYDLQNASSVLRNDVSANNSRLNDDNEMYVTDYDELESVQDTDEEKKEVSENTTSNDKEVTEQFLTEQSESTAEKANSQTDNKNTSEQIPESSTVTNTDHLDMEIDNDLSTNTAVVFPGALNGLEASSNEQVLMPNEAFEKLELIETVTEELDGIYNKNIKSSEVTTKENEDSEKVEEQNVPEKLNEPSTDNIEDIEATGEVENQPPEECLNAENASVNNDTEEKLADQLETNDENNESMQNMMGNNGEAVEELNEAISEESIQTNQTTEKGSPAKSERRKSIKLAAIFEDFDLDIDEEDEDMKILESLMLREDSDCSNDEVETHENSEDNEENVKENMENKTNKETESTDDFVMKEFNDNMSDENLKKADLQSKSLNDLNKNATKFVDETSCDEYVDDMALLMEDDSIRIVENSLESFVQKCQEKHNSKSPIKNLSEDCEENKIVCDSPPKEKITESDKENENESSKIITPSSNNHNEEILKINESAVEAAEKQNENLSLKPKAIIQSNIHIKNIEVMSPLVQQKTLPYVDTPRPTHVVNRSILGKKRKLSEELTDVSNTKKTSPLAEINIRNTKTPKLDLTEKIGPNEGKISTPQVKEQQPAKMKQDFLQKNSTPRATLIKSPNDSPMVHNKSAEKLTIQHIQKLPNITLKSMSSSASTASSRRMSLGDRHLNPVVRIKRFKLPKAEADSKTVKRNPLPKIEVPSAENPSTSKSISEKPKNKIDDDDVIDELLDQFNKESADESDMISESFTTDIPKPMLFNSKTDAQLLKKVGLNILLDPEIIPNPSCRLTDKFAAVLFDSGLANKIPDKNSAPLSERFLNLLKSVNAFMPDNSKLQMQELKRIIFLVTRWYGDCLSAIAVEKKPMLQSMQRYMFMFNFIPKSQRRIFYCEYCNNWFNNQQKMEIHRASHLEPPNSMACVHCLKVFKRTSSLKTHMEKCKQKVN